MRVIVDACTQTITAVREIDAQTLGISVGVVLPRAS
jgi:hypothetical protein